DRASDWTRCIAKEEMAEYCDSTVRAIEIALNDLVGRNVVSRKRVQGGYAYGIPFDTWPELPDRPAKVVEMPVQDATENDDDDDGKPKPGQVALINAPIRIKAGKRGTVKVPAEAGAASEIQVISENGEIQLIKGTFLSGKAKI